MKTVTFAIASLIICNNTIAQSELNDQGVRDTVALSVSTSVIGQFDSVLSLEVWCYTDETVLSFSGWFRWDNPKLKLDSAEISEHLLAENFSVFVYDEDDLTTSNISQVMQLGGFTAGDGLEGNSLTRRLWATYFFTISDWHIGDSIIFDTLSSLETQLLFVTMGPIYPISFQPVFAGPMKFPGIETSILDPNTPLPTTFVLYQNFPNPFNPITTIQFELEESSIIDLSVFNLLGQEVSSIYHGRLSAGMHQLNWDANATDGLELPTGIYLYRLQDGEFSDTKKMLLVR